MCAKQSICVALFVVCLHTLNAIDGVVASEKQWYDWSDGQDLAGQCGPSAPQINGKAPICNPNDSQYHCCSEYGYCGTGDKYCSCPTCLDYAY